MVEPLRHRQTKEAATDMFEPKATASHLNRLQAQFGHFRCSETDKADLTAAIPLTTA